MQPANVHGITGQILHSSHTCILSVCKSHTRDGCQIHILGGPEPDLEPFHKHQQHGHLRGNGAEGPTALKRMTSGSVPW